jgi:hypothetical protein
MMQQENVLIKFQESYEGHTHDEYGFHKKQHNEKRILMLTLKEFSYLTINLNSVFHE